MNKIEHNTNNDVYTSTAIKFGTLEAFSVVPILRLTKSGQWHFISDYSDNPFIVDESWSPNNCPEALMLDPNLEDPSGVICYRIVEDIAIYTFDGSKVTPDGDINNPNSKCVFVLMMTINEPKTIGASDSGQWTAEKLTEALKAYLADGRVIECLPAVWRLVVHPDEQSDIVFYEDKYDHLRTKPKLTPIIARQIVETIKTHCEKAFEQHSTLPKHDGNHLVEKGDLIGKAVDHYFSHTGPKTIMDLR